MHILCNFNVRICTEIVVARVNTKEGKRVSNVQGCIQDFFLGGGGGGGEKSHG